MIAPSHSVSDMLHQASARYIAAQRALQQAEIEERIARDLWLSLVQQAERRGETREGVR